MIVNQHSDEARRRARSNAPAQRTLFSSVEVLKFSPYANTTNPFGNDEAPGLGEFRANTALMGDPWSDRSAYSAHRISKPQHNNAKTMGLFSGLFGSKKPNIQELQEPLIEEMGGALIDSLPEQWTAATLEITVARHPDGKQAINHSIRNPQGLRDVVVVSPPLADVVRRLQLLCDEHGHKFTKLTFRVHSDPQGEWSFDSDWQY